MLKSIFFSESCSGNVQELAVLGNGAPGQTLDASLFQSHANLIVTQRLGFVLFVDNLLQLGPDGLPATSPTGGILPAAAKELAQRQYPLGTLDVFAGDRSRNCCKMDADFPCDFRHWQRMQVLLAFLKKVPLELDHRPCHPQQRILSLLYRIHDPLSGAKIVLQKLSRFFGYVGVFRHSRIVVIHSQIRQIGIRQPYRILTGLLGQFHYYVRCYRMVLIASDLQAAMEDETLGALAASITANVQKSLGRLGQPDPQQITIEAESTKLFLAGCEVGVLVVVTEKDANLGLVLEVVASAEGMIAGPGDDGQPEIGIRAELVEDLLELVVRRRIVRMLSEMSDERFFEGEGRLHSSILAELRNHAIPILAGRLPEEDDVVVRESIARLLSRVGGREAVAAITRAIGSEERTRKFRQDLLATYYLDPSKKRGEQAAQILEGAVSEAERTMRMLQGLNILLFAAGLLMIGVGITAALIGDEMISRVLGMTAALGSLGGLIVQLIRNPLERIQSSVARLVQIETAFTSFIWELNLNSTYIQSLYVADGKLREETIAKTVGRIEQAMELTMRLVSIYGSDQGYEPYDVVDLPGLEQNNM